MGLGGLPSIKEAYEEEDISWRKEESERRSYDRRKFIWKEVEYICEKQKVSAKQAVEMLEALRKDLKNPSLAALVEVLKKDGHIV